MLVLTTYLVYSLPVIIVEHFHFTILHNTCVSINVPESSSPTYRETSVEEVVLESLAHLRPVPQYKRLSNPFEPRRTLYPLPDTPLSRLGVFRGHRPRRKGGPRRRLGWETKDPPLVAIHLLMCLSKPPLTSRGLWYFSMRYMDCGFPFSLGEWGLDHREDDGSPGVSGTSLRVGPRKTHPHYRTGQTDPFRTVDAQQDYTTTCPDTIESLHRTKLTLQWTTVEESP